jgi:hypothetical protein
MSWKPAVDAADREEQKGREAGWQKRRKVKGKIEDLRKYHLLG